MHLEEVTIWRLQCTSSQALYLLPESSLVPRELSGCELIQACGTRRLLFVMMDDVTVVILVEQAGCMVAFLGVSLSPYLGNDIRRK